MAKQALAVPSEQTRIETTEPKRRGINWGGIGRYVALVVVVVIALGPFYWTAITSIKVDAEINASPPTLIPHSFTTKNYTQAFLSVQPAFARDLLNSTIVAISTTILALLVGSICAYAIARMKFRGKGGVLAIILSVQMFPLIALVGPLFVFFTNTIQVYNTYVALIIPYLVISLPVTVYFLTSFFRDLPPDLEESARVDGSSRIGTLWRIILPLAAPGVFTTAILSFITVWNDFLFGLTLTSDSNAQTVTVAIPLFNGEHLIAFGEVSAAAIIVTIPLVIMVLFLQRRIVSGLTAGAVKG
ncbi:MAG: carbohydrate ABC transporter permease [Ktedonobacteraceae bacterium]|nr:carbohydrate ABC transporter permease [Ktedonobacteraceae bacterium]MBV9709645.1 carbohydrate ABC transporter permease [Ktedonobacteraceae bacterium]